ncbi:MAG: hypothetical protein ACYDCK_01390 [Thermoplasmatota archaeon]
MIYTDTLGEDHNAIVTAVHDGQRDPTQPWGANAKPGTPSDSPSAYGSAPGLNVVYVEPDAARSDSYGRQINRSATSIVHQSQNMAHGNKWRHVGEAKQ